MDRYRVEITEDGRTLTTANLTRAQADRLTTVVEDQARRQGRTITCHVVLDVPAGQVA